MVQLISMLDFDTYNYFTLRNIILFTSNIKGILFCFTFVILEAISYFF